MINYHDVYRLKQEIFINESLVDDFLLCGTDNKDRP